MGDGLWGGGGVVLLAGCFARQVAGVWRYVPNALLDYMCDVNAHMVVPGAINNTVKSAALRAAEAPKTVTRL